jgi:hypothetical protein
LLENVLVSGSGMMLPVPVDDDDGGMPR